MEYVRIDCCDDSKNRPTMFKHGLLNLLLTFVVAQNVASSLGFGIFNSKFIPYFKQHAAPLCSLAKLEMTARVMNLLTADHHATCASQVKLTFFLSEMFQIHVLDSHVR